MSQGRDEEDHRVWNTRLLTWAAEETWSLHGGAVTAGAAQKVWVQVLSLGQFTAGTAHVGKDHSETGAGEMAN